jgi:DNA-directed RNA polymerase specialized sigma24 family protein
LIKQKKAFWWTDGAHLDTERVCNVPRKSPCVSLSGLPFEPAAPEPPEYCCVLVLAGIDVREAVHSLPAELREPVEYRFGFATGEEESLAAIGCRLGLTREAVRLRLARAFEKLRQRLSVQKAM